MAHFGKDLEDFNGSRCITIRSAEQTENFTVYVVSVTVGSYSWTVKHRYSEFFELHEKLTACYKLDKGLLPPKKLFGNHTESFVKKRQRELEIYLQTILLYLAHHIPSCLAYFLDFDHYEIHGITQAMAEDLYNRGESLLQSREKYPVTSLQLYSLTERLKLPEPTCDSGDVKKDLGHILDFITRTKHLKVTGGSEPVGTSNIDMSKLPFDLTLFKSLQTLEISGCNFHLISGMETIKQTLMELEVHESSSSMKEMLLQDSLHWKAEDGSVLVGNWDLVTYLDLSINSLAAIHPSIQLMPNVETLNLSHNDIEVIQNLHWLSQLTHVDLSHNRIHHIDSLHTKLGNIKVFILAHNQMESLRGFAKLFSLQTLDVSHNKVSAIEEMQYISHLPCVENVLMEGNNVTNTLDYRTKTLEMFGDRVAEVTLDQEKPTQKELDTVAVLQALSKAKNTRVPRKIMSRKNASAASLSDGYYGQTPPGSLSDQLDGGHVSGPISHSVPAVIPWSVKDSMSAGRSQSSFSQDSESSYNSAVDTESGLVVEKATETQQHPSFHQPVVPSSLSTPAEESSSKITSSTQPTSYNNNNNNNISSSSTNTNTAIHHELVPEAHPFDLTFDTNVPEASSSSRLSSSSTKPKKRLSNPSLTTTGLRKGSKSSLENVAPLRKDSSSSGSLKKAVEKVDCSDGQSSTGTGDSIEQHDTTTTTTSTTTGTTTTTTGLTQKRSSISTYNAADLPTTSNKQFVSWLHKQLLATDDFESTYPPAHASESSKSSILDILWCYAEQLSHPGTLVPCCVVLTPATIFIEKLINAESGFPGVPHLQPLYILSVKNIQQIIIGPCYCYFRLEESFVGKSGTFSLFGLDPPSVRRVVNKVISLCRKASPEINELDCVYLNIHSDLLKQIIAHEDKLPGSASDRLVLMIPIRMLDNSSFNFLILSEKRVYCVGLNCTHWPPPSFQSSTEDNFSLEILHEFSIINKIVDLKIHPNISRDKYNFSTPLNLSQTSSNLDVEFNMYQLSVNVSVSEKDWVVKSIPDPHPSKTHQCYHYLFPSSTYRDLFLDRLSNLRAEHENQTYPNVREEPEGGNEEQTSPAKCQNHCDNVNVHQNQPQVLTISSAPPPPCHSTNSSLHSTQSAPSLANSTPPQPLSIPVTETDNALIKSDSEPDSGNIPILPKAANSNSDVDSVAASPNHSEGNESFRSVLTDSDVYKEAIEYQGPIHSPFYSSSPKDDLSVSPMSNFSRASISPPPDYQKSKPSVQPVEAIITQPSPHPDADNNWHYEQMAAAKADSLPSSFDWKKFYFKSPLNRPETVDEHNSQGAHAVVVTHANPEASNKSDNFGNRLFLDLKNAISTSGGNIPVEKEDEKKIKKTAKSNEPVVVESEHDIFLKQCVKSYDLIHTLPTKLKPFCLMNGAELRKFFYTTIGQYSNLGGLQEELHYVVWSPVIPYHNPKQEIVSLVMLSTYAIYLVSDTEIKVSKSSRPSWMSHSRNQSDSAIAWKTERNLLGSPNKKHVKSFAVLKYKDLHQINIGLFDQCVRLTGSNEDSVFTLATRDRQVTEKLVRKLKQVLTLSISSPSPMVDRKSQDLEQDFYQASKSQTSKSSSEGLVYTHASKVNFVYPGDEMVQDVLYLIKEKIASTAALSTANNSLVSSLWFYMQCHLLSPSDDTTTTTITTTSTSTPSPVSLTTPTPNLARSIIITPIYFALAEEDIVTYPLPDFVRGLPENPCHEIVDCRHIDGLKSIQLYQSNPHWLCLTFADEKPGIVVDVGMEHFGQPQGGAREKKQTLGPEVSFKFFVQSLTERDKLVQVLEKLWKQQVSVVGRILDVHKV